MIGKVFENLLAAYNPETRDTARKQTGSYYTPRDVVQWMAETSIEQYLAQKVGQSDDMANRLCSLLDYTAQPPTFSSKEKDAIIRAIAEVKVLDPAVGSGAFPMGILHLLTLALQRLDPDNKRWEQQQKERAQALASAAFETKAQQQRDAELLEISETFKRYSSDFGRKLYLIQNSIFGVDIQSVACQIAKLRFFISLTIEQECNVDAANNFGIKPLPNLETRFIAADTLLGLRQTEQRSLGQTAEVSQLERELNANRERHFHATQRREKLKCRQRDIDIRQKLSQSLSQTGMAADDADKIAHWDPYDQNATAHWFDAEYMFGLTDGLDIILGNPPYIQLQKDGGKLGKRYKNAGYTTFTRTGDIYQLFQQKACSLLKPQSGLLCYITSNSWLKAQYGKATRRYFTSQHTPLRLLEIGKDIFENAIVDSCILLLRVGSSNETCYAAKVYSADNLRHLHPRCLRSRRLAPTGAPQWNKLRPQGDAAWSILSTIEQSVMDKMTAIGTPLKDWDISIYRGVTTGLNDAFIIDEATRQNLIAADSRSADILKPVLRGRDIQPYQAQWDSLWLIYARKGIAIENYPAIYNHLKKHKNKLQRKSGSNQWYELQASPSNDAHQMFQKEKLIWMDMSPEGRFAYSHKEEYCNNKGFILTGESLKYICAVLNSTLITWFMKNTARTTGMGLIQWEKFAVEKIPVPRISAVQQAPFTRLIDSILASLDSRHAACVGDGGTHASSSGCAASSLPAAADKAATLLDQMVYALYGLTEQEIEAVSDTTPSSSGITSQLP